MPELEQHTEKKQTATSVTQPTDTARTKRKLPKLAPGWWALIVAGLVFAVLGVCAVGSAAVRMISHKDSVVATQTGDRQLMPQRGSSSMQGGGMMRGPGGSFGDTSDSTNGTRVSGVVIAVDGSTITVAGNGTTTKVVVNDSTTYTGDDKPAAVNDTIMVVGTKSDDTITATRVSLQRE